MKIEKVVVGELETNCYIIGDEKSCVIIDPGADAPNILENLRKIYAEHHARGRSAVAEALPLQAEQALPLQMIILTHAHPDHIGAVGEVSVKFKCHVCLHSLDSQFLKYMLGNSYPGLRNVEDGEIIKVGLLDLKVIHTPGHTPGSICLYLEREGMVFSGDTLFAEGVGRTDLFGGDERALENSLKRLFSLPDSVEVYPGHGPRTNIKNERSSNLQWTVKE